MRYRLAAFLLTLWLPVRGAQAAIEVPRMSLVERREQIVREVRERIQTEILDRVLGAGKASVWVDIELEMRTGRKENLRGGAGVAGRFKGSPGPGGGAGGAFKTQYILPGIPKPKSIVGQEDPQRLGASQEQTAQQVKTVQEEVYTQEEVIKRFKVTVIHDASVAKTKLDEVRRLVMEAMGKYKVQKDDIVFRPAGFDTVTTDWLDKVKEPKVYIPLVYAFLLLLLLSFLFGPVSRFLGRYTEALAQKPAAEVNVESNIESPEGEGGGGGVGGAGGALSGGEDSKLDLMLGRQAPEEDDMKRFEPFSYINEENLKRLAQMFLLRREEPWLIAVVLSYIRPEYARQVLTFLPVELQAKVAVESLTVRQMTREQVKAIDQDIKDNVDFVVGGVERLTRMLEEADTPTRMNILEYLQNEKPVVYEYVRKSVLLFEDISSFPDREMQLVVRELKTETMARALQGAAPEVVNKFFNNMSAGAGSLLKESMQYQKEPTAAQIEEERANILDQIKTMEKEGKISVRERAQEGAGFQEELASDSVRGARFSTLAGLGIGKPGGPGTPERAPRPEASESRAQADPAEARRYFDAGMRYLQAGNMDEAVRYLRHAVALAPDFWDAYSYLGQGLYHSGRLAEAVECYEKYLEHKPDPALKAWLDGFKTQTKA
ncbi:MAG: FliG C-terminal domain-containing protein [Elusimicrobiota bacterium]